MGKYQEVKIAKSQVEEFVLNYSKDITYSVEGQEQHKLQIIYPNKAQSTSERVYPGIIYQLQVDTENESIYDKVPQLAMFAQRGYVIVLVENCREADYKVVLEYLHANAIEFNLAKEYLFVLREVNQEVPASLGIMKEVVTRQEDVLGYIKAIISLGNKEHFKELCEDTQLKLPPVLSLVTDEGVSDQNSWTEETFDRIEDFMSNYI